jgi:hypothetical protein
MKKKLSKWESKQYKIPTSPGEKYQENEKRKLIKLIEDNRANDFNIRANRINGPLQYGSNNGQHRMYPITIFEDFFKFQPKRNPLMKKSIIELEEIILLEM